jgi:hypothetical protein
MAPKSSPSLESFILADFIGRPRFGTVDVSGFFLEDRDTPRVGDFPRGEGTFLSTLMPRPLDGLLGGFVGSTCITS